MSLNQPLKIVFAGTPDFSASILDALLVQGHSVSAVYCQPDRRIGRGKKLAFGPVKKMALENNLSVEQPIKFNQDLDEQGLSPLDKLKSYQPDLMIVVAYGLILPQEVLSVPKYGCVNIHASLLPRWRGAAPIQRAIEVGDIETGITIMQMDKGLDTGNMLLKKSCPILSTDTGSVLHDRLADMGCDAINDFLSSFSQSKGFSLSPGEVQDDSQANYAHKLSKAEAEIDWNESAVNIERKIRAFNAWPVSYTYIGENRLRVWQASLSQDKFSFDKPGQVIQIDKSGIVVGCGDANALVIEQLQADGSRVMSVAEMLNGKSQWFQGEPTLGKAAHLTESN